MQYLLLIHDDEAHWGDMPEDERNAIYGEYMQFTEEVESRGILLGANQLQPGATATVVQRVLAELDLADDVLLWNVVPTHPGTARSNRRPTRREVEAGLPFARRALYLLVEPDSLDEELPELPGLRVPEGLYPDEPLEPGALTVPLALPELEPVVPVVPAAPVLAGARPAVCSRLPRSSASTRRSGCRQAISFWFLLLSRPMRLH